MDIVDFLGRGWNFPITVKKEKLYSAEGEDLIRESIILILATARGERVMRPEFGCRLNEMLFAANDVITATLIESYVEEALLEWEPRIEVLDITAGPRPDQSVIDISIDYLIKTTNNKYNLVYPFYLESVGK